MPLGTAALSLLLPNDAPRYVALFTAPPSIQAGTYEEVADSGYDRQPCQDWLNVNGTNDLVVRANIPTLTFPAIVDAPVLVTHWGLFADAVGGTPLAVAPVYDLGDVVAPTTLDVGDELRFLPGDLYLMSEDVA